MKNFSEDHQAILLLFANGAGEFFHKIATNTGPLLADALVVAQIVVAIGTALWFFRRARGAQLDNRIKEKKLKK